MRQSCATLHGLDGWTEPGPFQPFRIAEGYTALTHNVQLEIIEKRRPSQQLTQYGSALVNEKTSARNRIYQ